MRDGTSGNRGKRGGGGSFGGRLRTKVAAAGSMGVSQVVSLLEEGEKGGSLVIFPSSSSGPPCGRK